MDHLPPELRAQLEEQKKQCIFCKIIAGETESKKVYDDKLVVGLLDINPAVKGHTLFMQKEHYHIMPLLPPETFKHMFGLMPRFVGALKKAMLCTGVNIFIANGGVAGQQAMHFLVHLIPREKGDWKNKYEFNDDKQLDSEQLTQANAMLSQNLPLMLQNHFQRQPAKWHAGQGHPKTVEYLHEIKNNSTVIYEDEKALCVSPKNPQCIGHMIIYSQEQEQFYEELDFESGAHMFFVASYCATAVFEGLKAHGSNIILKTGFSDDNSEGRLEIHVLPRYQDDGLDVLQKPMEKKPNLDEIQKKIKDKMFYVEHDVKNCNKKDEILCINLDEDKEVIELGKKIDGSDTKNRIDFDSNNPEDEIKAAINRLKGK